MVNRREHRYAVPTDPTVTGLTKVASPAGFEIRTADQADEDRLRELDDELKQDIRAPIAGSGTARASATRPMTARTSIRPPIWWPSTSQAAATPAWSEPGTAPAAPGSA